MKPMCEANCGKRTQVYGSKYCPECHEKYAPARESLQFMPAAEPPRKEDEGEDFLLLNPCDGWHLARAIFSKDGEFYGFHNLSLEREFTKDFYIAWAKLPDAVEKLHPIFLQPEQERN